MTQELAPPVDVPADIDDRLRTRGYAVLDADGLLSLLQLDAAVLGSLAGYWSRLPADHFLKDGGSYRRRRHASFIIDDDGRIEPVAHRAHWQPLDYNALHGGMQRWFEPVEPGLVASAFWQRLLPMLAERATALRGAQRWFVETHVVRIDATEGIGRPTPEGAHRDGVDLVAVMLVGRHDVRGGETRVFDADGPRGLRFTMSKPGTTLLLDDHRMIHESTPIQPNGAQPWRDTLVVTLRAGGFQQEVE